ncbi:DegT/DnrJ/EryC1/StrS family aminotransferase [Desulfobacula sp.]|uniref:DegT/DnrJ/EryC1/StrS family aminotransferase n=1 Tax=Desulfobacula sp. TaxID=2593537 RepID=UPI0039B95D93|nr:hypothetical protein [Desulfobacula sp.]
MNKYLDFESDIEILDGKINLLNINDHNFISEKNKLTEKKNIILIEDAAESLGSSFKNHKVGSISDASIFSFCGNKVLTTGEGGAVVTNSKIIYDKIKLFGKQVR